MCALWRTPRKPQMLYVVALACWSVLPFGIPRADAAQGVHLTRPDSGDAVTPSAGVLLFTWDAPAGGATEYQFRLALKGSNSPFLVQTVKTPRFECRNRLPALATPWVWKVRARSTSGEFGPWSEEREFSIQGGGKTALAGADAGHRVPGSSEVPILQPKLTIPAAGGTVSQAEKVWSFAWSLQGDTRPLRLYQLRVHMRGSQKPFINAVVIGEQCAVPLDTAPLVAEWVWSVRTVGQDGSLGPWSSESRFAITIGGRVASQRRPTRVGRAVLAPSPGAFGGGAGSSGYGGGMGAGPGIYLGEFDSIGQIISSAMGRPGNFFGYATLRR